MKRVMMVLAVLALLLAAGCTGSGPVEAVPFEHLTMAELPPDVRDWITGATRDRMDGITLTKSFGDKTYLVVYGGTLPSRGYTVKFEKVERQGGKVTVTAVIEGPAFPEMSSVEWPLGVVRVAKHGGSTAFSVSRRPAPPRR